VAWLTGTASQRALGGGTGRTFRDQHAWCWNIEPEIPVTGAVYDEVQVDGIYLRSGWCALIAIAGGRVIGWQWCDREKRAAWAALLARFPAPRVVVTDGQAGILAAVAECWPTTRVQRCLVHVQRNVRTYLTLAPRSDAGRTLRALSLSLTKITTRDAATAWLTKLNDWHQVHGHLTRQRTYRDRVHAAAVPSWTRPGQTWWYTHDRLRKAYRLLAKLARKDVLFTYLDPALDGLGISSTTNQIEGGVNAQLRLVLRHHRGMTPDHARRAIEWWCYQHCENPRPPADLIRPVHWQPSAPAAVIDEPDGPAGYDTTTTAEEGLWARKGWAGHS
jgi:hypothetical protein